MKESRVARAIAVGAAAFTVGMVGADHVVVKDNKPKKVMTAQQVALRMGGTCEAYSFEQADPSIQQPTDNDLRDVITGYLTAIPGAVLTGYPSVVEMKYYTTEKGIQARKALAKHNPYDNDGLSYVTEYAGNNRIVTSFASRTSDPRVCEQVARGYFDQLPQKKLTQTERDEIIDRDSGSDELTIFPLFQASKTTEHLIDDVNEDKSIADARARTKVDLGKSSEEVTTYDDGNTIRNIRSWTIDSDQ